MNYAQLKFPTYEWLRALPKVKTVSHVDRSGKLIYQESTCEYSIVLFTTPTSVYGRFSYNEDGDGFLCFDVMEDGFCDHNRFGKALKFNRANYKLLCAHAQHVYEEFQRELFADQSYHWAGKTPEAFADQYQ